MPAGRPSDYSDALADLICERIAMGESLNKICKEDGMPCMVTIFRWFRIYPEFCNNYARAKEESAEFHADGIVDICDTDPQVVVDQSGVARVDAGWVQWNKVRIDTRKWVASKLKPKKYGDYTRNEITGKDGGAVQVDVMAQILSEIGSRSAVPVVK